MDRLSTIDANLGALDEQTERLVAAIAAGGLLEALVDGLRAREKDRARLKAERQTLRSERLLKSSAASRVRAELEALSHSWRTVRAHGRAERAPDRIVAAERPRHDHADRKK